MSDEYGKNFFDPEAESCNEAESLDNSENTYASDEEIIYAEHDEYSFDDDTQNSEYKEIAENDGENLKTKKRLKVNRVNMLIALLCVLCALIGGVSGGITGALIGRNSIKMLESEDAGAENSGESVDTIVPPLTENDTSVPLADDETTTSEPEPDTEPITDAPLKLSVKEIYANSVNSVVRITGETYISSGFFGQTRAMVAGSGFIISDDGYIVTNNHVVDGVTNLNVELYNGEIYPADFVGGESSNDVAVIKINASNLSAATLGDSETLNVGDELIIIGNPLGELSYSLTTGVVSALNRQIEGESDIINMFQTNATINSGNSGGPAFDENGEVVGIAAAKYASSEIEGLAFCIPINDVKGYIADIIQYGYARNVSLLGVTAQTVTSSMSFRYGILQGAYVIALGSPAQEAGIAVTDVIVDFDGHTISKVTDLKKALSKKKPGETVNVVVSRGSERHSLSVTLAEKLPAAARTNYSGVYDL